MSKRTERAVVIGAGSMGTLIAAVLGRVMPVVLVCRREERAAQLFKWGARVEGLIEAASRPILVRSLDELANAGGASLVVVATKTTAIPSVATDLKRVMGSICDDPGGPHVISFQNGIDPGRELMARLGHARVLRMVLSLGATLSGDQRCVHVSLNQPPHDIGSVDPGLRPVCESIAALLTEGGLETAYAEDIEAAVWRKGLVNAAMNPVAALVNCTVGQVLDSPSEIIVRKLLQEGIAVAEAEGITLPAGYAERAMRLMDLARDHVPSMVEDIRGGRESEIGQLNRQIIEHGARLGVPTRTHETIDALIETFDWKVYRDGAAP
ncbi:MAG: ketopantoate reductase family protein [Phycisphaerales bacterium]